MNILHLEDDPGDAALALLRLQSEWPDCVVTLVNSREAFIAELVPGRHDLILCDHRLPGFTGIDALALAIERLPDTPFIFLSGTVGEEAAVELVRTGAADYLLKDRMHRLPVAINRALRDRADRLQRRQADERIREQAELLDKARDGIVVTDNAGRIVFWNHGAERIFGWSAAEALGRSTLELVGHSIAAEITAMTQPVATLDEWEGELRLTDRHQRPLIAEVRVTLIRDHDGRPKSRLKIITDITAKKDLEAQFLRAQRLESLGMLSAGIAHDLNNILAPVLMGAPLLRSLATQAADQRVLDTIEKSAIRGAALVRQILSFAHGTGGTKSLIQLKHLLHDIAELIRQTFPKSIELDCDIPNTLWTVHGNPSQLHQILLNLCVNARDAMPHGGTLRLSASNQTIDDGAARSIRDAVPGDYVVLEVSDTGTGIAPENIGRIWEPFFTTKSEDKGTGLGLATVRGIVTSHGGFATADSTVGRGTLFRTFLPAAETSPADGHRPASAHPFARRGNGELVLVVDDEDGICALITGILTRYGYRVKGAANGVAALATITPAIADLKLMITDLSMPLMGGVDLARAVRQLNPTVRILFMSGAGSGSSVGEKIPASAGAITKPFTVDELLDRIRAIMEVPAPPAPT